MRLLSGAISALAILVFACSGKTTPPAPLPTPPAIKTFLAEKNQISAGESVVLSWEADNATELELVDQAGTEIEVTGDASAGTATVTPETTSFYVLRVKGEGGRDSAFVQVAVDEDLQEVFLVAIPSEIEAGRSAELLWSAFGAKSATLRSAAGQEYVLDAAAETGIVEVTPARTEAYTLVASGVDATAEMTATAQVKVRPVLQSFRAVPQAANPGETITFSWKTLGASEVTIHEETFESLVTFKAPAEVAQVDEGTFDWVVPETLPNGKAPLTGHPLRFTLTVKSVNPTITVTDSLDGYVGEGPAVLAFDAPDAVTEGDSFTLSWKTLNAERLQIRANSDLIYAPLNGDVARVAEGSIELVAPSADTVFELAVWGHGDVRADRARTLRVVKAPSVDEFLVPGAVPTVGSPAAVSWKTSNATSLVVRVKNGPTVYSTSNPAEVAAGSTEVYPGLATLFEVEAFNDARDVARAEKKVDVSTPATVTAVPGAVTPGEVVGVTWDLQAATLAQLFGDPMQLPLKNNPATDFFPLETHFGAQKVAFTDPDNAVAQLELPAGFRYPVPGYLAESFYVSTNGFVSFKDEGALADNDSTGTTASDVPALVAPFWDDLKLGATGEVLYLVEGTFPRRLIVQWNNVEKVRTDDSVASALTFQVQMWETGELRFAYKTLVGEGSAGDSATIGWRTNGSLAQEYSMDTPILLEQDEVLFLNSGRFTGDFNVEVEKTGVFTLYGRLINNAFVVFPAPVNVLEPGMVTLNEVMVVGDSSATRGQWIELRNVTDAPVDLSGTLLTSTATMTSWTLPQGLVLPAGAFVVVGESTTGTENGGAPVEIAWTDLVLDTANGDTLQLTAVNPIAELTYQASEILAGTSIQLDPNAIGASGPIRCAGTTSFGGNNAIGTPGGPNDSCFDYALSSIPLAFEDIAATGTPFFTYGNSLDSQSEDLDLSAAPFPYFGTPQSVATVSSNGWIAFQAGLSSYTLNETKPDPDNDPLGAVAVFWDDLDSKTGSNTSMVLWERRNGSGGAPGYWIIQWEDWTRWVSSSYVEDDLRFQAKLFDDGVIEFHYDTMTVNSSYNYAVGTSATIWIERPTGDAALAVGINQPVIAPKTAYRFTPNP
jgi:Lamin Tail Domain